MSTALRRLPLLMGGGICLVTGLAAGLGRLGWPGPGVDLMALHGPLMVSGFFGTVIGLERAVALGRPWGWGAPLFTALGGLLLVLGLPGPGALLLVAGSLVFLAMSIAVIGRQPELFTAVLGLGGAGWLAGNLVFLLGLGVQTAIAPWAAFLVLTIAGERLELSRFMKPWRWRGPSLFPVLGLVLGGALLAAFAQPAGWPVFGAGLVALVAWSLGNDVVRRTIRQTGLTRYVAVCLIAGYGWAGVSGLLMTGLEAQEAGPWADAAFHALFVGFVFSMVFGHAPVILPAVLRVSVPFRPLFYAPLVLLAFSLALRLSGDVLGLHALRQWGGLGNALTLALFIVLMLVTVLRVRR